MSGKRSPRRGSPDVPRSESTTLSSDETTSLIRELISPIKKSSKRIRDVQKRCKEVKSARRVCACSERTEDTEDCVQESAEEACDIADTEGTSAVEGSERLGLGLPGEARKGGRGALDERGDFANPCLNGGGVSGPGKSSCD